MTVEPMDDAELAALRHIHEREGLSLYPPGSTAFDRLFARLDAERTRADALKARALPEPRLLRTVEEVEALPEGHYFFNIPDRTFWTAVEKYCDDTWWMLGNECRVKPANLADSFYYIGPLLLPDLPTPTAAQEG